MNEREYRMALAEAKRQAVLQAQDELRSIFEQEARERSAEQGNTLAQPAAASSAHS